MVVIRGLFFFTGIVLWGLQPAWSQDYVPDEIIVKMRSSSTLSNQHQFVGKASMNHKMSLKQSWSRMKLHQFQLKAGKSVEMAIKEMMADPDVEYAEPNYILRKQSATVEYAQVSAEEAHEIHYEKFEDETGFALTAANINAEQAWELLGGQPNDTIPIVAIIDSGVDYNHFVFQDSDAIWSNDDEIPGNGIDDDGNGYIDDIVGWDFANSDNDPMDDDNHGTHVAGIVLGTTQDILAPTLEPAKVKLMPLKFLDSEGAGTTTDAIAAIHYALNNGATILNNSWGGNVFSQSLLDAIETSYNSKASFVAAAGNASNNNDLSPTYPASFSTENILSIAATEANDSLASFSNYGAQSVHVGSPGVSIMSTLPNDSFGYSNGTSMAAPFVSGLAAMMTYEAGEINGFQMREIIFNNSNLTALLTSKVSSQGRIDAYRAVSYVQGNPIPQSLGRSPASAAAGGCGLVRMIQQSQKMGFDDDLPPPSGTATLMLILLLAPLAMTLFVRIRMQNGGINRRIHPRYKIDSEVTITVGQKEMIGSLSSISLGGVSMNTEALLENGGVVTLSIASPDGEQQVEVQGRVIWSEKKKAYGVQFEDAAEKALNSIQGWTRKLAKE